MVWCGYVDEMGGWRNGEKRKEWGGRKEGVTKVVMEEGRRKVISP